MPNPPFYPPNYPGEGSTKLLSIGQAPSNESFGYLPKASELYLVSPEPTEAVGELRPTQYEQLTAIAGGEDIGEFTLRRFADIVGIESEASVSSLSASVGFVPSGPLFSRSLRPLSAQERFSGVLLNQNTPPVSGGVLELDEYDPDEYQYYQEFRLPDDYPRGHSLGQTLPSHRVPPLTGFQLYADIEIGWSDVATIDWTLERFDLGDGWQVLDRGTTTSTEVDGETWFTVYTNDPIDIIEDWISGRFRFGVRGRISDLNDFKIEVDYNSGIALVQGQQISIDLVPGVPAHFKLDDVPSTLYLDPLSQKVYYSVERGVTSLRAVAPNPLQTQNVKAFESDGTTPLLSVGEEASLMFRILAGIAEQGTDFLGNRYRNTLARTTINNVSTITNEHENQFWLSKPNPSQFAVESLYFDISDTLGRASTVDTVLIDPLTPGVFFNLYYTSEGEVAENEGAWEKKLWNRVPNTFQMKSREQLPLPQPITAKFLKVEFTHLQPRWYAPGNFQRPILYKKHPKWVLDYFLLRFATERNTEDAFIARKLKVTFDAFDLAYNYYTDDLDKQPYTAKQLGVNDETDVLSFLSARDDASDQVDPNTLQQIRTRFDTFRAQLGTQSNFDYLLSTYALGYHAQLATGERVVTPNHPIERSRISPTVTNQVSTLDREPLVYERGSTPMFFFIPCRHKYREVSATFDNDKAYFAGVNELAFYRERYSKAYDSSLYIESAGDTLNTERNDFVNTDGIWGTYEL